MHPLYQRLFTPWLYEKNFMHVQNSTTLDTKLVSSKSISQHINDQNVPIQMKCLIYGNEVFKGSSKPNGICGEGHCHQVSSLWWQSLCSPTPNSWHAHFAHVCSCCSCSSCSCFSSPWFLVVVHVPFHRSFKLLVMLLFPLVPSYDSCSSLLWFVIGIKMFS